MATRAHCLVLALPAQGHINPILQFSKLLERQGVRITLVTTRFYYNSLKTLPPSIALETISDGFDNGGLKEAGCFKAYIERFWQVGPLTFSELLEKLGGSKDDDDHVDCVVYDSFLSWAPEVAKRFGIVVAAYLTQNMVVNSIYYHVHLGKLQVPLKEDEFSFPAMPKLYLEDMPSFFFGEDSTFLDFEVSQFSSIHKADWILCNTFYELEKEIVDWIVKVWPQFKTIGPNIPSMFLDKQWKDDQDYGATEFKGEECMEWLDDKPTGSVVYVSFGSVASFGDEQMEEIACCLRECSSYFLWVVRASEETKLPKDFEKKTEKGLVVTWCSQLKVLAHEAVGCFVTHCGWNSTLETLCLGVPTVAIPYWSDQSINAKLLSEVWKIGTRALVDERKVVQRETLKHCIKEIMNGSKEMKNNAIQWRTSAIRAFTEGGSSYENVKEFVNNLINSSVHS
ncbi:UDP-glycosyltransferase 74G1-like [Vigna radiata var. radiata]|uniref:Glycosyltransferase n=1 Tax=Vigna radiata var. radiata TaxID=3916 RepID=A0A1S3TA51_VIGRR|nr:UDP-glycosyltransferase 74G1-like [Vigna radiata var. radiata]